MHTFMQRHASAPRTLAATSASASPASIGKRGTVGAILYAQTSPLVRDGLEGLKAEGTATETRSTEKPGLFAPMVRAHAEPAVQRQEATEEVDQDESVAESAFDHYDRLLRERQALLAHFQSRFHGTNCPAVASAVQRFLETGSASRARDISLGFACADAGSPFSPTDVSRLLQMAQAGGHGFQVVVSARDPSISREHFANIVNIHGAVYYVDAFTRPGVISAPNDIAPWLSWATELSFTPRYECRVVPRP